ncbi:MAG: SDR family oxidoreductase [Candidatus Thiodiazotropha sp. (ex Ustalcina ferruginea)]|nr:SDR family oxidoreductase [Candidatus Thiodiazotropha sp. (ex Ustalcina ferruginea)]
MIQDFKDKVAVITGGAHGIGYSMTRNFLDLGMKVVITASRQASLDEAAAKLNGGDNLLTALSDAGDPEANFALARLVEDRFGKVNLLCLNAGISKLASIQELSIESWRQQLAVNLDGPFYGVKAFLPLLEKQEQAHIVITSSIFSFFSTALQAPYFASKAGVTAFAESLHYDLMAAESNVGVTVVCPGNTSTNMAEANLTGNEDPALAEAIRAEIAKGDDPQLVTDATLKAIRENRFYVLPNTGDFQICIEARYERVMAQRNPSWEDLGEAI